MAEMTKSVKTLPTLMQPQVALISQVLKRRKFLLDEKLGHVNLCMMDGKEHSWYNDIRKILPKYSRFSNCHTATGPNDNTGRNLS